MGLKNKPYHCTQASSSWCMLVKKGVDADNATTTTSVNMPSVIPARSPDWNYMIFLFFKVFLFKVLLIPYTSDVETIFAGNVL